MSNPTCRKTTLRELITYGLEAAHQYWNDVDHNFTDEELDQPFDAADCSPMGPQFPGGYLWSKTKVYFPHSNHDGYTFLLWVPRDPCACKTIV